MALVVGIDIGHASVKAVAVRTFVRGYAPILYRKALLRPIQGARPAEEVASALATLLEKGLPRGEVAASAPASSIASVHFLDLPFTDRKKIEKVVPFEAESYVPFPMEGMQIAHQVVEKKVGAVRVIAVVAPLEALKTHIAGLAEAGLEPWILDCGLTALYTLGVARIHAEPGAGNYAIVDLGATHTGVVVVANQRLVSARSLGTGGNAISAGLASTLGVSFEEADRIKMEFGEAVGLEAGLGREVGSDSRRVAEGIRPVLDRIVKEVRPALRAVEVREKLGIEALYLVGGGARLGGVAPYLAREFGVAVRGLDLGDFPAGEPAPGPEAACALGLALRGVRGLGGSTLNFRRGDLAYRREAREVAERILPAAWPIALILLLVIVSFGVRCSVTSSRYDSLRKERSALFAQSFHAPEGPDPVRQAKTLIEADRKKLALLGGTSGPLEALREIASRIPADGNVLVNDFDADPERITFTALADSFEKAGKVRDELAKCPDFAKVEVSNQTKDKDQVRFTVTIQLMRGGE